MYVTDDISAVGAVGAFVLSDNIQLVAYVRRYI
jgi:hypothetical protein